MEVSNDKIREYSRRIMTSRMRLLCNNGFYGLLLMHIRMGISYDHDTAWTDMQEKIYFNPDFLDELCDRELDFVMMHEVMHIVLHHVERMEGCNRDLYNIAADIVVNSNILKSNSGDTVSITVDAAGGESMHLTPEGEEGNIYTVEELYYKLKSQLNIPDNDQYFADAEDMQWDYHLSEDEIVAQDYDKNMQNNLWNSRIIKACEAVKIRESIKNCGGVPGFIERYVDKLTHPQTDWRTVLDEFIQEEINDYSFYPPDRRFNDNPFYLPDYNEKDYRVEKILFMIDTSGSMTDSEIAQCYGEIKGAIDQFDGKLEGWLGFFDARVIEPKPFVDEEEFMAIRPSGGGGTKFSAVFDYVRDNMAEEPPVSIVILTDGCARFPAPEAAMDIPVLWLINNDKITPPWGKVTRVQMEQI